jgi:hypothetical protein
MSTTFPDPDVRAAAVRYRTLVASVRDACTELGPLVLAARSLGWPDPAHRAHLSRATLQQLVVAYRASTRLRGTDAAPPPLDAATLDHLARAGQRLSRLMSEQRKLRPVLVGPVRELRAGGWSWEQVDAALDGPAGENPIWLRSMLREHESAGRTTLARRPARHGYQPWVGSSASRAPQRRTRRGSHEASARR